jgi:hypothetical protein
MLAVWQEIKQQNRQDQDAEAHSNESPTGEAPRPGMNLRPSRASPEVQRTQKRDSGEFGSPAGLSESRVPLIASDQNRLVPLPKLVNAKKRQLLLSPLINWLPIVQTRMNGGCGYSGLASRAFNALQD